MRSAPSQRPADPVGQRSSELAGKDVSRPTDPSCRTQIWPKGQCPSALKPLRSHGHSQRIGLHCSQLGGSHFRPKIVGQMHEPRNRINRNAGSRYCRGSRPSRQKKEMADVRRRDGRAIPRARADLARRWKLKHVSKGSGCFWCHSFRRRDRGSAFLAPLISPKEEMKMPNTRCSEPGGSVVVAIVASRAPGR